MPTSKQHTTGSSTELDRLRIILTEASKLAKLQLQAHNLYNPDLNRKVKEQAEWVHKLTVRHLQIMAGTQALLMS